MLSLPAAKDRNHPAEIAAVGTPDRSLVHARSATQERRPQVSLDRDLIVGRLGQRIRPDPPPLVSDPVVAVGLTEPESGDGLGIAMTGEDVEELAKSLLALTANDPIDVRRVEHGRRVEAREVAAPHDRQMRMPRLERVRQRYGAHELRPGHDAERNHLHWVRRTTAPIDMRLDLRQCVDVGQIPIDDLPAHAFGKRRADSHHRQRESPVLRACGPGIYKDNHAIRSK